MNTGGCTVGSRPEERKMDKSKRKRYRIIRTIFGVTIVAAATWFYLGISFLLYLAYACTVRKRRRE